MINKLVNYVNFFLNLICLSTGCEGSLQKVRATPQHSLLVHKEGRRKQFPLVFALMSRKTEEDYVAVFRAIMESLQATQVEEFMVDFELGKCQSVNHIIIF